MCAGGLAAAMFNDEIVSVNTLLSEDTTTAKGLFIEMFMTAELVFVILMLAAEKSKDTFLAPIGIGLALFICELAGKFNIAYPRPLYDHRRMYSTDTDHGRRSLLHGWLAKPCSELRLCRGREKLS